MELQAILSLMADGEFHSGKTLGEVLGVSRTAVWKHLQKLDGYGLSLESVKGKGYRLCGGLELLDSDKIRSNLGVEARAAMSELEIIPSLDSTNSRATQRALSAGSSGYVCLAEHQTQGRGRRGRRWESPFGQSVYLSTVIEFNQGAAALEGLSLAVGVAIVRALSRLGVEGVGLKWPNDVLWGERKLAGVLLEMTGDPAGQCQVVVGLGLNYSVSAGAAAAIDQPWVDVCSIAPNVSRNELVGTLMDELLPMLYAYHLRGFAAYREEWEASHVHAGAVVSLSTVMETFEGLAVGLTDTGAIRLLIDGQERAFSGGEISLRAQK